MHSIKILWSSNRLVSSYLIVLNGTRWSDELSEKNMANNSCWKRATASVCFDLSRTSRLATTVWAATGWRHSPSNAWGKNFTHCHEMNEPEARQAAACAYFFYRSGHQVVYAASHKMSFWRRAVVLLAWLYNNGAVRCTCINNASFYVRLFTSFMNDRQVIYRRHHAPHQATIVVSETREETKSEKRKTSTARGIMLHTWCLQIITVSVSRVVWNH